MDFSGGHSGYDYCHDYNSFGASSIGLHDYGNDFGSYGDHYDYSGVSGMEDSYGDHHDYSGISGMYDHHTDCDTNYPVDSDPVQNAVCNISESHGFMDGTRECLIDEKNDGVGIVERHVDCWEDVAENAFGNETDEIEEMEENQAIDSYDEHMNSIEH